MFALHLLSRRSIRGNLRVESAFDPVKRAAAVGKSCFSDEDAT